LVLERQITKATATDGKKDDKRSSREMNSIALILPVANLKVWEKAPLEAEFSKNKLAQSPNVSIFTEISRMTAHRNPAKILVLKPLNVC
jgi:hypothetical protein